LSKKSNVVFSKTPTRGDASKPQESIMSSSNRNRIRSVIAVALIVGASASAFSQVSHSSFALPGASAQAVNCTLDKAKSPMGY
jgi:hypothetical protein